MSTEVARGAEYWDAAGQDANRTDLGMHWLENREVQRNINQQVSGDAEVDWVTHALRTHFRGRTPIGRVLSLGCGEGQLERKLASHRAFVTCDAWDASPGSIALARERGAHIPGLTYEVRDCNAIELEPGRYDAIWIDAALHHFDALEHVSAQMRRGLTAEGLLVLNEFIGPNRFQFPQRQKEIVNACLRLLPTRYRLTSTRFTQEEVSRSHARPGLRWYVRRTLDKLRDGALLDVARRRWRAHRAQGKGDTVARNEIAFPSVRDLVTADPTEAVRSAEILSVLKRDFSIVEYRPYGGNVLQFLLGGIAANFTPDDPSSIDLLHGLMKIERGLLSSGELQSDFAFIVLKPA